MDKGDVGEGIEMAKQEDKEFTSSTNTPKILLYVEQFSWKTNWKLTEGLLHNQGWKTDTHKIR